MTNRQKKREAIKQTIAERHKRESIKQRSPYEKYSRAFDLAKRKGYLFKEGAMEKFTEAQFEANAAMFATMAPGLADEIKPEDAILDEQLSTSTDSIDQAVFLWNTDHEELVAQYGYMTRDKFRSNEGLYFRELRNQYGDDAAYDLAMSY